jgi:predicted transposase/invertase (TIGR01784 family)
MLAKKSVYLDEAYKQLEIISQDEEKRLEYTARQKALYDYNTLMEERFEDGFEKGTEQGIVKGKNEIIDKMRKSGMTDEQIQLILSID